MPAIKAATGATVYAEGPHRAARPLHIGEHNPLDACGDRDFRPDVALKDGEVVTGGGWTIEAVTTPGHTANHMAYRVQGERHAVCRRSCDGLGDLDRGAARRRHERLHGLAEQARQAQREDLFPRPRPGDPRRGRFVNYYILHRKAREASILHGLAKGETDIPSIVRAIYIGIDPRLTGAAGLSVLAHMEDLVTRGVVETDGAPAIDGTYRLWSPGRNRSAPFRLENRHFLLSRSSR